MLCYGQRSCLRLPMVCKGFRGRERVCCAAQECYILAPCGLGDGRGAKRSGAAVRWDVTSCLSGQGRSASRLLLTFEATPSKNELSVDCWITSLLLVQELWVGLATCLGWRGHVL